jgi:myo-inositol-1(or 4)-monophosphatase
MQPQLNIAINAARQAGDVILRHIDQAPHLPLIAKGTGDYFCEVDIKAEQAIIATILKAYPDHGIQAEESGNYQEDAESVWIIDPLDGTKNFIHGFPFYAVSIALRVKSRIEHAVVYDPLRHECFAASRGRGARLNDRRIRVSKETQISKAMLSAGMPIRHPELVERYMRGYQRFVGQCSATRVTGSAALDLAYVACGRLDGFWGLEMKAWDVAAGVLLVQEAGGLISDLQGGEHTLDQGNVIAGPPKIFKSIVQTLSHLDRPHD